VGCRAAAGRIGTGDGEGDDAGGADEEVTVTVEMRGGAEEPPEHAPRPTARTRAATATVRLPQVITRSP
jgi:hypothetical protein